MNNNTKNSDGAIPEKVLELIPWYAIGNLSVDDQVLFDEALVSYPSLLKLVEFEKQMIKSVATEPSLLEKSAIAPTEERLKSVLNMIDIEESKEQTEGQQSSGILNPVIDKLRELTDFLIPSKNGAPQYARAASLGVLVLSVAVLTAFVAPLFTDNSEFVPASAVNTTDVNKPATVKNTQTTLLVGFKGSSIDLGNNTVLKGKVLKIESVPEKEGIFQISFKQAMSSDEIKQMIDALLAQKETIWFAGEAY